jgi:hypothetical protein
MKYMFANMPKLAKEFASRTNLGNLPNKVMPSNLRKHIEKHGFTTNSK